MTIPDGVEITSQVQGGDSILTPEALDFVARLHREFDPTRRELLEERARRQAAFDAGEDPAFLEETRDVRRGDWRVAPPPPDLANRRVEITGPTDRKMIINSPTWDNMVSGQANLIDAIDGTIEFRTEDKQYRLNEEVAVLLVRPRGWHLPEKHMIVDGRPVSGALFDFGLYFWHNARRLLEHSTGPYFYLPKLESHLEARLWNQVFEFAQDELDIPRGTVKATVLVETILAGFEMDEILYELRDHSAGLNAGRWDYIFSIIKKFRSRGDYLLPDRIKVTMTVPFMRAYTDLLVKTCHRRGAHAMGGMAAFIPSRRRPEINEEAIAKVRDDKRRESGDGFDGTWVAHPDLVSVAKEEFDRVLGDRANQVDRQRDDVSTQADDLLNVKATPGEVTLEGLRNNVNVGIQYISSWLRGNGAAAIYNLMEDAATAEIARSQVWQWVRHGAQLEDGSSVTRSAVAEAEEHELDRIRTEVGDDFFYKHGRPDQSRALFERVALGDEFVDFLPLVAYEQLD
jgi:malate synthase